MLIIIPSPLVNMIRQSIYAWINKPKQQVSQTHAHKYEDVFIERKSTIRKLFKTCTTNQSTGKSRCDTLHLKNPPS